MGVQAEVAEVLRLRHALKSAPSPRMSRTLEEAAQDRVRLLLLDYGLDEAVAAKRLHTSTAKVRADLLATRKRQAPPLNFSTTEQMGRWARELRERKGMTAAEVGQSLGLGENWVEKVESGQPVAEAGALPALFKLLGARVRHYAVRN